MGVRRGSCPGRCLGLWGLAIALACTAGVPVFLPPETLRPLEERAERARRLRFREPVQAQLLSRGEVKAHLAESIGRVYTPELCTMDGTVKKTLGLLPVETDLCQALVEFQSHTVAGLYAPLDGRLYVVARPRRRTGDASLGRQVDQVLVHELVHALQAMHTDLDEVMLGLLDHDDLAFALAALIEGDATWAGYRDDAISYGLPVPPPEQVASNFDGRWSGPEYQEVPRLVRESLVRLYPSGYALVTQILDAGGVAALNAALQDPPLSSAEVLHPERYLDPNRRGPLLSLELETERIAPSSECTTVGTNTFGEFGLGIWAQERGMGSPEAAAAAEGWDADRAVVFDCPTGTAFAWLMQFGSAEKARMFAETARRLARPSTQVDDSGTRVLLWANLAQSGRDAALLETQSRSYRDLSEYLDARPEILERTRMLRSRLSEEGDEGGGHHPAESRGDERERDL